MDPAVLEPAIAGAMLGAHEPDDLLAAQAARGGAMTAADVQRFVEHATLALKETEDSAFRLHPLPPLLLWRLFDALAQAGEMTIIGGLRGLHLPQFVRQAGFVQVQCSVTTIERWAPLRPVETAMVAELVAWLADQAETLALPTGDLA